MRWSALAIAGLVAACGAAAVEPGEDDLRQALTRNRSGDAFASLAKVGCDRAGGGRYLCTYELPDCPPYKPRCGRTRAHRGRFALVAGNWQYLGAAAIVAGDLITDSRKPE